MRCLWVPYALADFLIKRTLRQLLCKAGLVIHHYRNAFLLMRERIYIAFSVLVFGLQPRDQSPPDYRLFMRQFYSIGNSLNQIARKAHALNVIDAQKYDEEITKYHDALTRVEEAVISPEKVELP